MNDKIYPYYLTIDIWEEYHTRRWNLSHKAYELASLTLNDFLRKVDEELKIPSQCGNFRWEFTPKSDSFSVEMFFSGRAPHDMSWLPDLPVEKVLSLYSQLVEHSKLLLHHGRVAVTLEDDEMLIRVSFEPFNTSAHGH